MLSSLDHVNVADLFNNVIHMRISAQVVITCVIFSSIGAIILGRFAEGFGNMTFPLNFSALFIGTFIANSALDGLDIPAIQYQQEVLMFTVAGMISVSFGLMWMSGSKIR